MSRYQRFKSCYAGGNPPWNTGIVPPEVVEFARQNPSGSAIDSGCGTGTSSIYLAQQGWQVTGVDFIEAAVMTAHQNAQTAGLNTGQVAFIQGDVTAQAFLPDHDPVTLWLDIGCFHGFDAEERARYASHVSRLLTPSGTLLMYAHGRVERDGRPHGIEERDVLATFTDFLQLQDTAWNTEASDTTIPAAWYTFTRSL
jgi:SAM-dependent methyltransferase